MHFLSPESEYSDYEATIWLLSANFATSILLGLLIMGMIVVLRFDDKASFNKLSLLPYYFVIGYTITEALQFLGCDLFPSDANVDENPLYLLNITKVWFIFTAINF